MYLILVSCGGDDDNPSISNPNLQCPNEGGCSIIGNWKLCYEEILGFDLNVCSDDDFLDDLHTWDFRTNGELIIEGVRGYEYKICNNCNEILISEPNNSEFTKIQINSVSEYEMQWASWAECNGQCNFYKWDGTRRVYPPTDNSFLDCSLNQDECDIKGDYFWVNAPIHPLTFDFRWDNLIRISDDWISFFLGHSAKYELTNNCKTIELRNTESGIKQRELKIISNNNSLLTFEDPVNCPDEPCQLLKVEGAVYGDNFDEYARLYDSKVSCSFDDNKLKCNCNAGFYGKNCVNKLDYIDFPNNTDYQSSIISDDNSLISLISNEPRIENNTYLLKTSLSGQIIWQFHIPDIATKHSQTHNSLIVQGGNGNYHLMYYLNGENIIQYIQLDNNGNLIKSTTLNGRKNGGTSPRFSFKGNRDYMVFVSVYGDMIKLDNNGNILTNKTFSRTITFFEEIALTNLGLVLINQGNRDKSFVRFDHNLNIAEQRNFTFGRDDVEGRGAEIVAVNSNENEIILTLRPTFNSPQTEFFIQKYVAVVLDGNMNDKLYLKGVNSSVNAIGYTKRLRNGDIIYLNNASRSFFMKFDPNGNYKYSYLINYLDTGGDFSFKEFEPTNIISYSDKYYFVGRGYRFVNNVLINEFDESSLYNHPLCEN